MTRGRLRGNVPPEDSFGYLNSTGHLHFPPGREFGENGVAEGLLYVSGVNVRVPFFSSLDGFFFWPTVLFVGGTILSAIDLFEYTRRIFLHGR